MFRSPVDFTYSNAGHHIAAATFIDEDAEATHYDTNLSS